MEKALKLYNSQGAFPSADNQIEILSFNYDAKRMGGAPIITAMVMHGSCLDAEWTDDVYVEFNGEKYYLKQTPTSSFSNTDARYKHDCEFVSERIKLDNVYFFDTVVGDPQGYDKPVSNSSVFSFFGNIREFAKRLNASLQYSKLQTKNDDGTYIGYVVIVNNDVDDEEKLLSFSNVPFSTALQESYNQFEIPYYFVGKEIHFGYWQEVIEEPFRYGVDKELLSITKTNANQKVITRCTGTGGTENIPYYYPNAHPQGELIPLYNNAENVLSVEDEALFAKNILLTDKVVYTETIKTDIALGANSTFYNIYDYNKWAKEKGRNADWRKDSSWFVTPNLRMPKPVKEKYATASMGGYEPYKDINEYVNFNKDNPSIAFRIALNEGELRGKSIKITLSSEEINFDDATTNQNGVKTHIDYDVECYVNAQGKYTEDDEESGDYVTFYTSKFGEVERRDGKAVISFEYKISDTYWDSSIYIVIKKRSGLIYNSEFDPRRPTLGIDDISVTAHIDFDAELIEPIVSHHWAKDDRHYNLSDLGLSNVSQPTVGDAITFKQSAYVQPMPNLMPPVYWESNGEERFYNALNNTYDNPETGDKYTFANPYSDSKRVEHIVEFPDIKPTIEGMTNNAGQPINAFLEFAYDVEDNDAVDQNGNYIHPYFYAKLPKFDSFNLFTHANEKGEVTFSMKSGNCGACNFVLGVDSESGKNTVQVDENGLLKRDNSGDVIRAGVPQDKQNDTQNNEVWVALKKDNSTFGTIMPSAQHGYYPAAGDTFVLLNITMPVEYVKAAENRLKEEIVKYMYENNVEKFSFSIKFSRIYLAEKPQILNALNENAFIKVEYNGKEHPLYVNSFAYKMTAGEALPEITIELAETLSASMNAIQAAVSQVRTDVLDRVQKMDIAAMVAANFLSKNNEDYAKQKITFKRGISVGTQDAEVAKIDQMGHAEIESATLKQYISSPTFRDGFSGEGFKMWLDENGLSYLTVDVLTARQRMVIYEMLVEKSRSVNGGLWVSSANGRISDVVDNIDNYEIYFEDINTFVKGDYMRCQVYTGADMKSYWVEVSNVDGGVVLVSKDEFAPYNTLPQIGDDVFLCGSKNVNRQNAIHISATEDGQPRISIYNGISTKSLAGCLRTQLGNLDNIDDNVLKPQGDGLYSNNAYLKGEFVLKNSGKSVDTMFAVTEEGIKASIEQTQAEAIKGKTLLYNASFIKGLDGWLTSNTDSTYFSGTSLLFASGSMLSQSVAVSSEPIYDNVFFVNIKNGWIKQSNLYFVNKPAFEADKTYQLFFSTNVRCHVAGTLIVKVGEGEKGTYTKDIDISDKFVSIDVDNLEWSGSEDFYLSFSGEADFYGLTIYTEKTEVRHKTLFEQTDKLIGFSAFALNNDGTIRNGSEVKVTADGTYFNIVKDNQRFTLGEFTSDEEGKTKIKLSGDNIILEGDVTANGKVKIDSETGALTADSATFTNGTFTGKITSDEGEIGGFEIGSYSLTSTSTGSVNKKLVLQSNYVLFDEYKEADNSEKTYLKRAFFGTSTGNSLLGVNPLVRLEIEETLSLTKTNNTGIYINVVGTHSNDDANASYGNHAIVAYNGDYAGLRMRTRRVGSNVTLSPLDNIILCVSSGPITITLPAEPKEGQLYMFKKTGTGKVTIKVGKEEDSSEGANDKHRIRHAMNDKGLEDVVSVTLQSERYWRIMVWDFVNKKWQLGD